MTSTHKSTEPGDTMTADEDPSATEESAPQEPTTHLVGGRQTLGPVRTTRRKPKLDDLLAEAVDTAREALQDIAEADQIGEHRSAVADDDRLVTHRFSAQLRGYRGWEWYCTLARAPRSKVITVCEVGLLSGEDSLIAPEWVPWSERANPEEKARLDAIAAGEDPQKAVERVKQEQSEQEQSEQTQDEQPAADEQQAAEDATQSE